MRNVIVVYIIRNQFHSFTSNGFQVQTGMHSDRICTQMCKYFDGMLKIRTKLQRSLIETEYCWKKFNTQLSNHTSAQFYSLYNVFGNFAKPFVRWLYNILRIDPSGRVSPKQIDRQWWNIPDLCFLTEMLVYCLRRITTWRCDTSQSNT